MKLLIKDLPEDGERVMPKCNLSALRLRVL